MDIRYVEYGPDGAILSTVEAWLPDPPRQRNESEQHYAERLATAKAAVLTDLAERSPAAVQVVEADQPMPSALAERWDGEAFVPLVMERLQVREVR